MIYLLSEADFILNSSYLLKLLLYYTCFSYSFIFSEYFDNYFAVNFSQISKNINIKNTFNLKWLNYFIVINFVILYLIIKVEIFLDLRFTKIVIILIIIYMSSFFTFNKFFFWNSFSKFNPNIFIMLMLPLIVNVFFYKNYITIVLSLEYLSVCSVGYLSSFFYKNINGLLSYIWSSIFSALLVFLLIFYIQLFLSGFFYDLIILFYYSIKIGLMPLGFWLYYFYNDISVNNIINYLSCIYIINIVFVIILITVMRQNILLFTVKDYNTVLSVIKYLIILFNVFFINIFYFNSNFKKILFINTLVTATIIYTIIF